MDCTCWRSHSYHWFNCCYTALFVHSFCSVTITSSSGQINIVHTSPVVYYPGTLPVQPGSGRSAARHRLAGDAIKRTPAIADAHTRYTKILAETSTLFISFLHYSACTYCSTCVSAVTWYKQEKQNEDDQEYNRPVSKASKSSISVHNDLPFAPMAYYTNPFAVKGRHWSNLQKSTSRSRCPRSYVVSAVLRHNAQSLCYKTPCE